MKMSVFCFVLSEGLVRHVSGLCWFWNKADNIIYLSNCTIDPYTGAAIDPKQITFRLNQRKDLIHLARYNIIHFYCRHYGGGSELVVAQWLDYEINEDEIL